MGTHHGADVPPRLTSLTWPLFVLPLVLLAMIALVARKRLRKGGGT